MGPGWTQALRFPAGSHLHFVRTLAAPLRKAIEREMPEAISWMGAIDGAKVTVEWVDATGCALRIAAALSEATVECSPAAASTFDIRARARHEKSLHERTFNDVVIMLGGTTDVYQSFQSSPSRTAAINASSCSGASGSSEPCVPASRIGESQGVMLRSPLSR